MALSNNLISQFVKATSDNNKSTKNEGTAYGTTDIYNGKTYVKLDGSEQLTPVSTTANTKSGERVMVKIKNHSATIVGNLTSPAARIGDVNDLQNDVNVKFDTTNGAIEAEVSRSTEAEGELASRIKVTEDAISTEVTNRQNADSQLSSSITQTASSITSEVNEKVTQINNDISAVDEKVDDLNTSVGESVTELSSKIEQTANEISTEVTARQNADSILSSQISQTASNFSIELSKKVGGDEVRSKFAMSSEKVTVSSGRITFKAGTIVFEGNNFSVDEYGNLYIVGSMTFSDGDNETTILDHDGRNRIYLQNLSIDFNSCTDYSSGQELNNLAFLDDIPDSVTYASKLKSTYDATLYTHFTRNGNFVPSDVSIWCGTKDNPFQGGYGKTGWNTTSDIRLKKDFVLLENDKRFENMFYMLKPISYRFIDGDEVAHIGFGAQPVKEAMDLCGIREDEFYGFHHEYSDGSDFDSAEQYQAFLERNEGNPDTYSLCYEEFIALNTHMIQVQHEDIEKLKQENLDLQSKLAQLEQRMEELENVISKQNN